MQKSEEQKRGLTLAHGYGVNAFMKGQPRIPARDNLFMELCKGREISGHSANVAAAWLAGWDSCNANPAGGIQQ